MKEKTVSVSKFKSECLSLLRNMQQTGEPLLITKHGKPLARVTPPSEQTQRKLGTLKDKIEILDDIISPAGSEEDWEVLR